MTTASAYTPLALLRDQLATVAGVQTCRIGMEANMTPDDYPMVRIVPSLLRDSPVLGQRQAECLIYFGQPIHEFTDGMEALYEELLTMEATLIEAAETGAGYYFQYIETVMDEDRVDGYKLLALRGMVEG